MNICRFLFISLSVLSSSTCIAGGQQLKVGSSIQSACLSPCIVSLTGTLITEIKWGPPNFGETPSQDSKVEIYILELTEPLLFRDAPDLGTLKQLQIDFPIKPEYKRFIGKRVKVEGRIVESVAPLQYTPAVIDISKISYAVQTDQ